MCTKACSGNTFCVANRKRYSNKCLSIKNEASCKPAPQKIKPTWQNSNKLVHMINTNACVGARFGPVGSILFAIETLANTFILGLSALPYGNSSTQVALASKELQFQQNEETHAEPFFRMIAIIQPLRDVNIFLFFFSYHISPDN